jgi:hypothetical protein
VDKKKTVKKKQATQDPKKKRVPPREISVAALDRVTGGNRRCEG